MLGRAVLPMYALPAWHGITGSIEDHVTKIVAVKNVSYSDPELRQLAVKIVSSSYVWRASPQTGKMQAFVKASWGQLFPVPKGDPCAPRDDVCEVVKVWDFVVQNFRYVYDPNQVDVFATYKVSLRIGGGDCDDATILFGNLLEAIGFYMRCRVISVPDDPKNWVHIYPLVGLPKDNPNSWIPLDVTVKGFKPGDEWPDIARQLDFDM